MGKTITVVAKYTDVLSTAESMESTATTAVANVNDANTPTPTPTGTISITNSDGTTSTIPTSSGGVTTVPSPVSGSTLTISGTGSTNVTNPSALVTLNNTGTGTVSTTGMQGDTTLKLTGTGTQQIDITGMKPGDVLTIDNSGTGVVDLSNLPDGVIVKLVGNGPVVLKDNDGASPAEERSVPALAGGVVGDGNGDGTPDGLQSNVASLSFVNSSKPQSSTGDAKSTFVTLVTDSKDGKVDTTDGGTASLENVKQIDAPANLPPEVKMPLGQISFDAKVSTAGAAETFSIYVESSLGINAYWKQNAAGTWINLASSDYGGKVITEGGKTRLDFKLIDGGEFDSDGKADGIIKDPGAPGYRVNPKDTDADQFPDALEAANGLVVGVKDNDVFGSSKLFVMQLYRDILYREADTGGLQFWQNVVDTGTLTRSQVASTFLASPEFQGGAGGLVRLYFGAMHRLPDYGGMTAWMGVMHGGSTLGQVGSAFASSKEFNDTYGSLDNKAFVEQLYLNVQGRVADPGGEAFWLGQLNSGLTRGEVLLGFTESAEYRAAKQVEVSVALDYLGLLGRTPDQAGFDFWVDEQKTTTPEVTVVGGFIESPEYLGRFLP